MLKAIAGAEIFLIPPKAVPSFWHLGHTYLNDACNHTACEYTADMLLDECFVGQSQLWLVWSDERGCECAVVTGIMPHCATCIIKACGGHGIHHWLGLLDEIERWAKQQGCVKMRLFGRQGWRRVLPDYRVTRVIMDKELV